MDYNNYYYNAPGGYGYPQQQPNQPIDNDANIKSGGFSFTVIKDDATPPKGMSIDRNTTEEIKRKRPAKRKTEEPVVVGSTNMVTGDDKSNEVVPTMYTYQETTDMLRGTLMQIDQLASQVKNELDNVVASRTLKSKYSVMVGLSANLGDIIGQKITAIKEINNAISKSNEMDYKLAKDRKAMDNSANDDKFLMDMYNAYIQNPQMYNGPTPPTSIDATVVGSTGIVRDSGPQATGFNPDNGYLNYVTNMTPEQRLMSMESNPNIKLCVIYDAATGNKAFQYMNMATGEAVTGMPQRDPMFLQDTTIDISKKIAKNINLNETYPVVILNEHVVNEY